MWKNPLTAITNNVLNEYYRALNQLQQTIFSIYLERDYSIRHFAYEKILQKNNMRMLDALHQLRQQKDFVKTEQYRKMEHAYDVLMDIGTLRYRVKDLSVLEICEQELTQITAEITSYCEHTRHNTESKSLRESIFALETIYQNVLQTALPEPVLFAIFIESLFSFDDILEQLNP